MSRKEHYRLSASWGRVTGSTPLFFRYFLIGRLEEGHPQLVANIRGLDVGQLDLLWEQIREHQQISNW